MLGPLSLARTEGGVEELAKQYIRRGPWGVRSLPGIGVCTWHREGEPQPRVKADGGHRKRPLRLKERPLRLAPVSSGLPWDNHFSHERPHGSAREERKLPP